MLSIELDLEQIELAAFFNHLRWFPLSVSLGGVESLIEQPSSMSHKALSEEARHQAGITPGIVRIAVGCEHREDLLNDLQQGLDRSQHH